MNRITVLSITIGSLMLPFCHNSQNVKDTYSSDTLTVQGVIHNFDNQLQEEHLKDTTGSLSAIVFIQNEIVWSKAFGKADNEKGIDAGVSTVYRIGSISKTFTSYLMMLLVQDGIINLDESVAKYLPEVEHLK